MKKIENMSPYEISGELKKRDISQLQIGQSIIPPVGVSAVNNFIHKRSKSPKIHAAILEAFKKPIVKN